LNAQPEMSNTSSCKDINPGSLHIVAANLLENSIGFVGDRDRSIQVWNQPVFGYESQVIGQRPPSQGSAPGTVVESQISTTWYYGKERVPSWDPKPPIIRTLQNDYWLELDAKNNILGGSYIDWDRFDFIWNIQIADFSGYFSPLKTIYQSATKSSDPISHNNRPPLPRSLTHKLGGDFKESTGLFGTPDGYQDNESIYWRIHPTGSPKSISIHFEEFSTERYRDKLKIYEGAEGEGALVAVLHGNVIPADIVVQSQSIFVVFKSDDRNNYSGFKASWKAIY